METGRASSSCSLIRLRNHRRAALLDAMTTRRLSRRTLVAGSVKRFSKRRIGHRDARIPPPCDSTKKLLFGHAALQNSP
ncbi:hypothetical protein PGT21_012603 [Puccinia graminis f. sp. tritici]|uniref:Uncharacterized protein n=1 Tax=Puccinia graminis f. sp. tritici TaxID=56615 RepID=A0A5B0QFA0_PUCGR|nr:hypothetical protein PGT21_012603 [Puccinia graminis f. sp. tritici]